MFFLKKTSPLLIAVGILLASYFIYGFYNVRYEALINALTSSQFTPGMPYDNIYYLGHVLLVKVYALFFSIFPDIPWMAVFQYSYLAIGLAIIVYILIKKTKSLPLLIAGIVLLGFFFAKQTMTFISTNVGFITSFSALLAIAYQHYSGKLNKKQLLFLYFIFLLGFLTRTEAGILMIVFVGLFHFLIIDQSAWKEKFIPHLKIYAFPISAALTLTLFVLFDSSNSDAFYKQIEPDVEYELTARNNIIPISEMTSKVDSFRYLAIYKNIWGDATTNDASFLRSLIGQESDALFSSFLLSSAWASLQNALKESILLFYFNIIAFIVLLLYVVQKNTKTAYLLLFYELFFWFTIALISYSVKMTNTGLSAMLFILNILYLSYFLIVIQSKENKLRYLYITVIIAFGLFYGIELKSKSIELDTSYKERKKVKTLIDQVAKGKNIFLTAQPYNVMLDAFRPFEGYNFSNYNRVVLFDSQHITTLEPYRSYLANFCKCDPNNYEEFFSFVIEGGQENVFIMTTSYKDFLTEYLKVVHQINISWKDIASYSIAGEKEDIHLYAVVPSNS